MLLKACSYDKHLLTTYGILVIETQCWIETGSA